MCRLYVVRCIYRAHNTKLFFFFFFFHLLHSPHRLADILTFVILLLYCPLRSDEFFSITYLLHMTRSPFSHQSGRWRCALQTCFPPSLYINWWTWNFDDAIYQTTCRDRVSAGWLLFICFFLVAKFDWAKFVTRDLSQRVEKRKSKKSRLAMDERSALETISVSRQQQVVPPRTNESYGSGSAHTRRRAAAAVVEEESDERNKSAPTYSISSDVWRQKRRNIFALFASSSSSSPLLGARQLPCWSARH